VSPRRTAFRTPTGSPQRGPLYVRLVRRTGQCFRELARRGAQSFRSLAPRGGSNFLRTETSFTSSSLCERLPADANPAHRHRRDILERSVVASCCVKECEPGHFQASFTAASRCGRVNGGRGEVEKIQDRRCPSAPEFYYPYGENLQVIRVRSPSIRVRNGLADWGGRTRTPASRNQIC
jgi:hypothetical protein